MKIKNINTSILILTGLIVLSFAFYSAAKEQPGETKNIFLDTDQDGLTNEEEKIYGTDVNNRDSDNDSYSDGAEIRSGHDPKKPAPGDSLFAPDQSSDAPVSATGKNMTENVAQKIAQMAKEAETGGDNEVSLEEIESLVDETLNADDSDEIIQLIPEIDKDDLRIKKQDYSKLSKEEAATKKKEDFSNYITAVFYIFSSNSPQPLTSADDITSVGMKISQDIMNAIATRDTSTLAGLNTSGEKMIEQLKEVEVPEELLDIHIKALQYAYCAKGMQQYLENNADDPLKDIANFSKMQGFVTILMSFGEEVQSKFEEYGLEYDENIKEKLADYGIKIELDENEDKEEND